MRAGVVIFAASIYGSTCIAGRWSTTPTAFAGEESRGCVAPAHLLVSSNIEFDGGLTGSG